MNKGLKIFLLAFSVLLVLGVTLIFLKTILDPPRQMSGVDPFEKNIREETATLQGVPAGVQRDSLFYLVMDEVAVQYKDSLLDATHRDAAMQHFLSAYTPLFRDECNALFGANWTLAQYKAVSPRLAEIKSCKKLDGSPCYPVDMVTVLSQTFDTVEKARHAAAVSKFRDESSARRDIQNASYYKAQYPVTKCQELKNSLDRVPSRIEQSHYAQIESIVSRLKSPQRYADMAAVNSDMNAANDLIKSYRSMSYSGARSMERLESEVSSAYSSAYYHFNYGQHNFYN